MRIFLGLFLLVASHIANAEPTCISYPASAIPPEVRVQVWNQFLQDNPKTEHREKILKEIEQALDEMWGKPDCNTLLRDATVNPFKNPLPKKNLTNTSSPLQNATIDPFDTQDGMLIDPFKQKAPPQNSSRPIDENSTYDPFVPSTPTGPKGPKKPVGTYTVDPWETPPTKPQETPEVIDIDTDGVLVDPFRKKKSK
jgi:hypothetical protein